MISGLNVISLLYASIVPFSRMTLERITKGEIVGKQIFFHDISYRSFEDPSNMYLTLMKLALIGKFDFESITFLCRLKKEFHPGQYSEIFSCVFSRWGESLEYLWYFFFYHSIYDSYVVVIIITIDNNNSRYISLYLFLVVCFLLILSHLLYRETFYFYNLRAM